MQSLGSQRGAEIKVVASRLATSVVHKIQLSGHCAAKGFSLFTYMFHSNMQVQYDVVFA